MRIWIFRIPTFIFALVILVPVLLMIPAIGKRVVKEALISTLEHNLTVQHYVMTPFRFELKTRFDDNSSLILNADKLVFKERTATLQLDVNTSLLDRLSGTVLPSTRILLGADYNRSSVTADIQALEGDLNVSLDPRSLTYEFNLAGLDLGALLALLKQPAYAAGILEARGNGALQDTPTLQARVQTAQLDLQAPLLALLSPDLGAPQRAALSIDATLNLAQDLDAAVRIDAPFLAVTAEPLHYNLDHGDFKLDLNVENRSFTLLPLQRIDALAFGQFRASRIDGNVLAEADDFALQLLGLDYDLNQSRLETDLRFMTLTDQPVNLAGPYRLSGHVAMDNRSISAVLGTRYKPEVLQLRLAGDDLHVTTRALSLAALLAIGNLPASADANVTLDARVDLNRTRFGLALHVDDLMPEAALAASLGLNGPSSLRITSEGNASIAAVTLGLSSSLAERFDANGSLDLTTQQLDFIALAKTLQIGPWSAPKLRLNINGDLDRSRIGSVRLSTPFERLVVRDLQYAPQLEGRFDYRVARIDRFAPDLNASFVLKGSGRLKDADGALDTRLKDSLLGKIRATYGAGGLDLNLTSLKLATVFGALNRQAPLEGDLSLALHQSSENLRVKLHAPELNPLHELNATLRPFALDLNADLSGCGTRYIGKVTMQTPYERLILDNLDYNLQTAALKTRYQLHIFDSNITTPRLPMAFGRNVELFGDVTADARSQKVTLDTRNLILPLAIHRKLDKSADAPLPFTLSTTARHDGRKADVNVQLHSVIASLDGLRAVYDLNRSCFDVNASLLTKRWYKNTDLHTHGCLTQNGGVKQSALLLRTAWQEINVTKASYGPANRDLALTYRIRLRPMADDTNFSTPALLYGAVDTWPIPRLSLDSDHLQGELKARLNPENVIFYGDGLSMVQLSDLAAANLPISRGGLDFAVYAETPAIMEGNVSALSAGIDIKLNDTVISGIAVDDYLSMLRNAQDFSLFQGSVGDLPFVRSLKRIPGEILSESNISTVIRQGRIGAVIREGNLTCEDCALATARHRIATAGTIDLTHQRFAGFYGSLIDPQGCSYYTQEVSGPLASPEVDLASTGVNVIGGAVVSIASNVTDAAKLATGTVNTVGKNVAWLLRYIPWIGETSGDVLEGATGAIDDATGMVVGCKPFYTGSVRHPGK